MLDDRSNVRRIRVLASAGDTAWTNQPQERWLKVGRTSKHLQTVSKADTVISGQPATYALCAEPNRPRNYSIVGDVDAAKCYVIHAW